MKSNADQLVHRTTSFMKLAISPANIERLDDAEKAFEYICKLVGQVPTPVGNPFSIISFSLELDKGDYFSAILYLLTSIPALGTIGAAISKAGFVKQGAWVLARSVAPVAMKKKILMYLVTFYQAQSWVEMAKKIFTASLMNTNKGLGLKAYAKKIGVQAVDDTAQLASAIADKMVQDISVKLNETAVELGKVITSIPG